MRKREEWTPRGLLEPLHLGLCFLRLLVPYPLPHLTPVISASLLQERCSPWDLDSWNTGSQSRPRRLSGSSR